MYDPVVTVQFTQDAGLFHNDIYMHNYSCIQSMLAPTNLCNTLILDNGVDETPTCMLYTNAESIPFTFSCSAM